MQIAAADDVMDRVLAYWRLVMRGRVSRRMPALGADAGIRRLLLLGLAVVQEAGLLATIAEHDPDPAVRREAVVWLWRVAPDEGLALLRACVLAEPDDEVLDALVGGLGEPLWAALAPELEALLAGPAWQRVRAAELLIDHGTSVSAALRRAVVAEPDPQVRARLLLRWAGSRAHASLLAAAAEAPAVASQALQALHAAGRRYEWELLRGLEAPDTRGVLVRVMGPPFSAMARGWLLARVQRALAAGDDPEELLGRLAEAIADGVPERLGAEDGVIVSLLANERGADLPAWVLAQTLGSSSRWLRHRAAERWVAQAVDIPQVVRRFALGEANPVVLARWARSDAHHELLAALRPRTGTSLPWQVNVFALAALAGAQRQYAWAELEAITGAAEDACAWTDDASALGDLVGMIAQPWPPEARAWAVQVEPQLTRPETLDVLWAALMAVPEEERAPAEVECVARLGERRSTMRLRDVSDWSFEDMVD